MSAACVVVSALPALAQAGEPATVTVRVEGEAQTLLAPTQVTTNAAPVVKDGNPADSCPGTNAVGALQLATGGNWSGEWYGGGLSEGKFVGLGYSLESVLGESHPFTGSSYWTFWWNDKPSEEHGVCEAEMKPGDSILFFPECDAACSAPPSVLGVEAPTSAELGSEVDVTVTSYANPSGTPSPATGASIAYEGSTTTTDSQGHATLRASHVGDQTLRVTAPNAIRTEATVCIHAGNDGNCGTSSSASSGGVAGFTSGGAPYKGPYALVSDVTSIHDGAVYRRGHGPRLLAGQIHGHSAVSSVSLELRRSYKGRCSAYDGTRERFVPARCGTGSRFQAATSGSFSYLLPAALGPGRYVLDVSASDVAGNTVALVRGTSRMVFYVR
ncbi:MAG: hypothetical protein ACLQBB_01295 [Solirubrobacteraceae bacterium]